VESTHICMSSLFTTRPPEGGNPKSEARNPKEIPRRKSQ
jgi:hypothetical protein